MNKKILSLLLLFLLLLSSCGGKKTYRDDVTPTSLVALAVSLVPTDSDYKAYDSDFPAFYFESAEGLFDAFAASYAVAPDDYNEFAVFHVKDPADIAKMEEAVEKYLHNFDQTYRAQAEGYDPSELEKINDMKKMTFGNYVCYAILLSEDQEKLWPAVEKELTPR